MVSTIFTVECDHRSAGIHSCRRCISMWWFDHQVRSRLFHRWRRAPRSLIPGCWQRLIPYGKRHQTSHICKTITKNKYQVHWFIEPDVKHFNNLCINAALNFCIFQTALSIIGAVFLFIFSRALTLKAL